MALKLSISFPIFAPPLPNPNTNHNEPKLRPQTEIRFSRWNNANAEKFNQRQRAQQEIEDDIRRYRRFESANRIVKTFDSSSATEAPAETYKSKGTPSSPSSPSIPGKKSKYSKPPNHPAFRKFSRTANPPPPTPLDKKPVNVSIGDDGVSFVIDGAPFEFKYSYTETPKVKPLKLREPPYSPFGPTTTPRPWTGRAPLPPSKKKMKEFDSFVLPPPNKKGVKPIQKPGPYLAGTGPRYVRSREEILGEPLTSEEVKALVDGCLKTKRQLNMGRDGLTHNMLDNIHAHWKRRRVCKIKCKGVCTVDMDNVCEQLEDRTGGKVIYRRGGVLYLFRGRNYNYKTRPRFPIMLWKPATPVYPRLIEHVPDGLTLEEATEMRKKGRKLIPICKLGKNGVYSDLVRNVREAFEVCELVRINCEGIKGSDYRRIGAKLKELVPCVLISFENEHILIWRGQNRKSSLQKRAVNDSDVVISHVDNAGKLQGEELSPLYVETASKDQQIIISQNISVEEKKSSIEHDMLNAAVDANLAATDVIVNEMTPDETDHADDESETTGNTSSSAAISGDVKCADGESQTMSSTYGPELIFDGSGIANEEPVPERILNQSESCMDIDKLEDTAEASQDISFPARRLTAPCTERILLLMKQAVESGSAVVLDDGNLDADIIYEKAVAFAKTAQPGPVFRRQPHKVAVQKSEKQEPLDLEVKEVAAVPSKRVNEKRRPRTLRIKDIDDSDIVARGSLKVDELAKLLA